MLVSATTQSPWRLLCLKNRPPARHGALAPKILGLRNALGIVAPRVMIVSVPVSNFIVSASATLFLEFVDVSKWLLFLSRCLILAVGVC